MMTLKIAVRNILRNRRRSAMTASAIAVGAVAMLLFGGFMAYIVTGLEYRIVRSGGHLSVFHAGYFDFGAGNPAAYGIRDYEGLIKRIHQDPVLGPMVRVATPTVTLFGIAGNFAIDASKTFYGVGVVPSDRDRMREWDEYDEQRMVDALGLSPKTPLPNLRDDDASRGVVGVGLARILGLCAQLNLKDCPQPPAPTDASTRAAAPPAEDFTELAQRDRVAAAAQPDAGMPRIDLLGATAGGAPNVVSLYVRGALYQNVKELDDAYVGMHISLAQRLLYGRGEHDVTSIVLQLYRTEDIPAARARLVELFTQQGLPLEVHDFTELEPFYNEVMGFFGATFGFIAAIMSVIVLFTVVNTMSMSVMERTTEIGTLRAMGVRRRGIRHQFVVEGFLLGLIGATAGVILAQILAQLINRAGLVWMAPGQAAPIPLLVLMSGVWKLVLGTWVGLILLASVASLIPANRGARMPVVDALRHV